VKIRLFYVLASILTLASAAFATPTDDEAAHAALRQIKAVYEKAVSTGDLTPLKGLFLPETTAVMLLGQEIKSYDELEQHWKYVRGLIGPGGSYSTTLQPETSLIYGDFAVSRGTSDEVVKTGAGKEFRYTSRWTAVSRRVGDQWKVIRLHGSMDPVTNVFTMSFLRAAKLTYGIGGLMVGALLGAVLVLLVRKRPASA
jgi:ketosteroid isomerase-like protein